MEVLYRIYAHCIDGDDGRWHKQMEDFLWLASSPDRDAGDSCFPKLSWADAAIFIPRIFRDWRHRVASGGIWLHSRSVAAGSFSQVNTGLA